MMFFLSKRSSLFTFIILICLYACDHGGEDRFVLPEEHPTTDTNANFKVYLAKAAGRQIPKEKFYYVLISSKFCSLCESGVMKRFELLQEQKLKKNILFITDMDRQKFPIFNKYRSQVIYDTAHLLLKIDIPLYYITTYKTSNFRVEDITYISDSAKFFDDLLEEGKNQ